ncbi:carbohydrate ABC transporter substrate-binding protein (CUT1 family) [Alicyclobacillus sacchari]|uniref:Probable sugar-binding periplasmic protein n=1 Tax=Alicyclobacillus sacchari TaxID=392010 RepID=A0A4R8LU31_9BACL|nr:ABC transporter substrate-binding protein [Alicyclobacillus sacchari]TDY51249.1 carbohydrate ABC transporter substrate-binding protein (CUT1 family) [Alicyclobacillus sacchari]
MKKKYLSLAGGAVLALGVVTACGAPSNNTGSNASSSGSASTTTHQVEIFSWWTAGGEANGLNALIKTFNKEYPQEKIVNEAVAGGGGSNAKAVLASRMQAGDPPETFQVHAGQELMAWVNAGKMQPLDNLYKSMGLNKVIPAAIINDLSKNGHVYAVPVDVGRGNVLWYNPAVLKKYHLTAPTTMSQFISELKTLKSKGVTPLAYGDKDQLGSVMLWENVLLATMGPQNYDKLWQGKISFNNPQVKQATNTFLELLQYTNSNHSALTWDEADQMVADGSAAFNLMGDWAKAYFQSKGLKEGSQFGWTAFPGTNNDFEYVIDSFGLPKGAKNPTGAMDFLKLVASKQGQDEFNPLKGSIPPRTDANMSLFDTYSKEAMSDFKKDSLVPSLANGEAANPAFETAATQAVTMLISTKNVNEFISALNTAAEENPLS